jgi:hypothetical protein
MGEALNDALAPHSHVHPETMEEEEEVDEAAEDEAHEADEEDARRVRAAMRAAKACVLGGRMLHGRSMCGPCNIEEGLPRGSEGRGEAVGEAGRVLRLGVGGEGREWAHDDRRDVEVEMKGRGQPCVRDQRRLVEGVGVEEGGRGRMEETRARKASHGD